MNIFGKKQNNPTETLTVPELSNMPSEKVINLAKSSKEEETVEFYLCDTRCVTEFEGKELFALNDLERLLRLNHDRMEGPSKIGGYAYLYFTAFTDGKETVRFFYRVSVRDQHYDYLEYDQYFGLKKGEPLFKTNEETNQVTFYPSFFKAIAMVGKRLLRIQAPTVWHQERRTQIDPEIQSLWTPEWK